MRRQEERRLKGGGYQGDGNRQRHHAQEQPNDTREKCQGEEGRNRGCRCSDNRDDYLIRADHCGSVLAQSQLLTTIAVLHDHDRVVNDKPENQHHSKERIAVERLPERLKNQERDGKADGNPDRGYDRVSKADEHKENEHKQTKPKESV